MYYLYGTCDIDHLCVCRQEQLGVTGIIPVLRMFARNCHKSTAVLVVDPFAGTGSVAVAARALGCSFIGMDSDPFSKIAGKALMNDTCIAGRFTTTVFWIQAEQKKAKQVKQGRASGGFKSRAEDEEDEFEEEDEQDGDYVDASPVG
jgi:hypothetical protein